MFRRVLVLACAATMATACASAGGAAGSTATRASHNILTADEMAQSQSETIYDTIRRLRPMFLRSRDQITTTHTVQEPVHVWVNGQRTEGIDALRTIQTSTVQQVRFYEPQEANTQFGMDNNGGVVSVTLKP